MLVGVGGVANKWLTRGQDKYKNKHSSLGFQTVFFPSVREYTHSETKSPTYLSTLFVKIRSTITTKIILSIVPLKKA